MAKILVVDAERNARTLVKRILEEEGHEVVTLASADEAKAEIWAASVGGKQSGFDLLITDIKISGGSGIDLIKDLNSSGIEIPILVTGGAVPPESVANAMKAGAIDFLSKPFSENDLLEKVNTILNMEKDTFGKLERRAKELLEAGNLILADKVIKQMFSINPSSPVSHYLYYRLLRIRGNESLALKHLKCALEFDPKYQPAIEEMKRIGEEKR